MFGRGNPPQSTGTCNIEKECGKSTKYTQNRKESAISSDCVLWQMYRRRIGKQL